MTLAAWALVAAGGAALGGVVLPASGLRGHYYTNLTRSGPPIAVSIDRRISTDTLDNGIAGVWHAFSAEWTGFLVVHTPGTYHFATISDDGSELEVNRQIVVQNGGTHGPQEARGSIRLGRGVHPLRLRYEQAGGAFALEVRYARDDAPLAPLGASRLLVDEMSYGAYLARSTMPVVGAVLALIAWLLATRSRAAGAVPAEAIGAARAIDRPAFAVALIVLVGVAARVVMFLGSDPILWGDSEVFLATADAVKAGRFLEHDSFRTLLYPYFLAAFLRWGTEPPIDQMIGVAQHALGLVASVCFFFAGRQAVGGRAALAGALLFSISPTELFYEASILSEAFFTCLLAVALLPLCAFVERPSPARGALTGAACAILTLTRPVAEWFVVVPLAAAMGALRTWSERARVIAVTAAAVVVFVLPWALVNQQQFGFFGVALGRGFGLFIRVFDIDRLEPPDTTRFPEIAEALAIAMPHYSPATFVRDELRRRRYSTAQADEMMNGFAMETIRRHPWAFTVNSLGQWWVQTAGSFHDEAICASPEGEYVCSARTIGFAREPFLNRPRYPDEPVRPVVVAFFRYVRFPMAAVTALATFGAIAALADVRRRRLSLCLALTIAYFTFLPAVAQSPQARYRLPIDALLFMFAAFGLGQLWRQLRPHRGLY